MLKVISLAVRGKKKEKVHFGLKAISKSSPFIITESF